MKRSTLEQKFATLLDERKIPYEEQEYFAPPRKYRADFVITMGRKKILVETHGIVWGGKGGHGSGVGIQRDAHKALLAHQKGYEWLVATNGGEADITVVADYLKSLWKKHKAKAKKKPSNVLHNN